MNVGEPAPAVRRFVWCSAGGRQLHGRTRPAPAPAATFWQRLLGRAPQGGTLYVFEPVDEQAARSALAAHLREPGAFALETAEGARIDFLCGHGATVTLDCWFFECEEPLDCVVIARAAAVEVVAAVYAAATDREVAARLLALERTARAA